MHRDPSPENVESAAPGELIVMLFEGAVRFGNEAREALADGDHAAAEMKAGRVRAIVRELDAALNHDAGTISGHLAAIYDYILRRLEPDTIDDESLEEVTKDLQALGETWTTLSQTGELTPVS